MNKFLVFSDLHLHNWAYGSTYVDGWNTRLLEQEAALVQMETFALENGYKNIVFTGDMFHTHQTIQAQPLAIANRVFRRWWEKHHFNMIFLVGNHDMADRRGEVHSLDFLKPYGHVIQKPTILRYDNRPVYCCPYIHGDPEKVKRFVQAASEGALVFMHQGVKNVAVNSKGFILKDEIFDPNDVPEHVEHVFVGHYHSFKHVTNQVTIPGSPMQHTWSDAGEPRGFVVVADLEAGLIYPHDLANTPQFIEVNFIINEDARIKGNFLRCINFEGDSINDTRDKLIKQGARSVEFINTEVDTLEAKVNHGDLFNMPKLVEKFMNDNQLDEDMVKTGLALMEGQYPHEAIKGSH